jgi:hypothetical protein
LETECYFVRCRETNCICNYLEAGYLINQRTNYHHRASSFLRNWSSSCKPVYPLSSLQHTVNKMADFGTFLHHFQSFHPWLKR